MAKKKNAPKRANSATAAPSKAQAVRDYRRQNPDASNDQVVAALKERGIQITPNNVSVDKSQDNTRARKKAAAAATPARRTSNGADAARFAGRIAQLLSRPFGLLVEG
jgi:hypothetical protein